jgi:hypothetical protein
LPGTVRLSSTAFALHKGGRALLARSERRLIVFGQCSIAITDQSLDQIFETLDPLVESPQVLHDFVTPRTIGLARRTPHRQLSRHPFGVPHQVLGGFVHPSRMKVLDRRMQVPQPALNIFVPLQFLLVVLMFGVLMLVLDVSRVLIVLVIVVRMLVIVIRMFKGLTQLALKRPGFILIDQPFHLLTDLIGSPLQLLDHLLTALGRHPRGSLAELPEQHLPALDLRSAKLVLHPPPHLFPTASHQILGPPLHHFQPFGEFSPAPFGHLALAFGRLPQHVFGAFHQLLSFHAFARLLEILGAFHQLPGSGTEFLEFLLLGEPGTRTDGG